MALQPTRIATVTGDRRAPDDPHQQLIKRMVAVEGDAVWEEGKHEPTKIPQVPQRGDGPAG